jgi:hypothetical protein
MLHQPISNDHRLNESLYQALIHHFIDNLTPAIQALLENCYFGIAPNSANIKTFFIVADDVSTANQLIQEKSQILHRMNTLMVGIGQLGICVTPSNNPTETALSQSSVQPQSDRSLPQYMMCQIFDLSQEC